MESLWKQSVEMPSFPSLEGDVKTDALIIGGGLAGLLTAYMLKSRGVDCAVAERNVICGGNTGNTTAKITFQHGLIYRKILRAYGRERAAMYMEANRRALEKYAELCKNIDCDFCRADNYVYTMRGMKRLEKEISALDKIGYKAELCIPKELPFITDGAVRFKNQAQFDPLKFAAHIAKGLNIYEHTPIREMQGLTAVSDGGKISAKAVICATHFPFINKHGSYFLKLYQHRSYVIALENAQQMKGMYVDENKTGLSFRNSGDHLLLGGGGHRTGKKGGCWEELRDAAEFYYPSSEEKFHWSAQDCMSLDGIPYIGRYSRRTDGLYVATGFNKWGMTGSMTAAMLLSDMVCGEKNDCAEVFSPSRNMLKPQLAVNGFEAVKNLLTVSEKRCPHMGCALKWNPDERSWDCVCHGSRFTEQGSLLDNPANGDLNEGERG